MRKSDAYIQQMSVKADLRDMIEKRFIKQVDYGYIGDDGNTVTITFLPLDTDVTFFDDEAIITSA